MSDTPHIIITHGEPLRERLGSGDEVIVSSIRREAWDRYLNALVEDARDTVQRLRGEGHHHHYVYDDDDSNKQTAKCRCGATFLNSEVSQHFLPVAVRPAPRRTAL